MKLAYFDCISGISGDMTLGALVDAGVPFEAIAEAIASLQVANCRLEKETVKRHGFRATKIHVRHEHEHAHRHLHHVHEIIDRGALSERQRALAKAIFQRLAEAEAKVHGTSLEKVHFHEVGAVDSIADIVGSAVGLDLLGVERFYASAVPVGTGTITIAHGLVSLPAPATADLLQGIPIAESEVKAELTTPTGASILATVVDRFGPLPAIKIDSIGYGAGDRELETQANVLRLLVGQSTEAESSSDPVWQIDTNLDDSSPELIGHCSRQLFAAGALDVFHSPIQMKKQRPGTKVSVICRAEQVGLMEQILFAETTTFGLRKWRLERTTLERKRAAVKTEWGVVSGMLVERPDRRQSFAPEYESCRQMAETHKMPLQAIHDAARQAFLTDGLVDGTWDS